MGKEREGWIRAVMELVGPLNEKLGETVDGMVWAL